MPGVHLVCIDLQPAHPSQELGEETEASLRETKGCGREGGGSCFFFVSGLQAQLIFREAVWWEDGCFYLCGHASVSRVAPVEARECDLV